MSGGVWSTARHSVTRLRWRLYLVLLVQSLLPTVYTTTRVHLLGNMPSSEGVNIASQAQWVGLFFEVRHRVMQFIKDYTCQNSRCCKNA